MADEIKGIPTVSRVAGDTLIELIYDPVARKTGLVVSRFGGLWNIEQEVNMGPERLIPYSATNNLIANDCVQLPSQPVEFGFKDELVADISAFLHRYVDLSPTFELIAAYYILLTWVYDRFGEIPYLRLRGEYGTGKTRALLAIGSLCNKAFFASGASTTSPIFHTLDAFGGTLVLDEADLPYSDARADVVKLLNNGTVRGMPVLRTIINRHREFNPAAFKVYGPKVIAMRGSFEDQALESRFLTEETGRRPIRSDIPIHLPREMRSDALVLRNRLLHFRLCEYFKINTDQSALIEGVEPRLNQTALSLLSLVDDLETRRAIQTHMMHLQDALNAERRSSPDTMILKATIEAFNLTDAPHVSLAKIIACMKETERPLSNRWVGHVLRNRFSVMPRKSNGIYVIDRTHKESLLAAAERLGLEK